MVSLDSVETQLKKIGFNHTVWNHAEAVELQNILLPEEEIYECVNGTYEGGFALLAATNVRLLLIDKKPFKFLTVEDLRFDLINQIDYSHRLFGARISVSAGTKNLKFLSFNQERLRKLIGHVQHCMAEVKQQQSSNAVTQQRHLENINQQLQAYLIAQHEQQEELKRQLDAARSTGNHYENDTRFASYNYPPPVKPPHQLSDYLYAQSLIREYNKSRGQSAENVHNPSLGSLLDYSPGPSTTLGPVNDPQTLDLYQAGREEVFSRRSSSPSIPPVNPQPQVLPTINNPLEINPLRIAYSKLPLALRNRAFIRRSNERVRQPSVEATA